MFYEKWQAYFNRSGNWLGGRGVGGFVPTDGALSPSPIPLTVEVEFITQAFFKAAVL